MAKTLSVSVSEKRNIALENSVKELLHNKRQLRLLRHTYVEQDNWNESAEEIIKARISKYKVDIAIIQQRINNLYTLPTIDETKSTFDIRETFTCYTSFKCDKSVNYMM